MPRIAWSAGPDGTEPHDTAADAGGATVTTAPSRPIKRRAVGQGYQVECECADGVRRVFAQGKLPSTLQQAASALVPVKGGTHWNPPPPPPPPPSAGSKSFLFRQTIP